MRVNDNITTILADLPTTVHGFVTFGSDYQPLIVINSRMTVEQQRKTYRHELNHILRGDLWDEDYTDETEYGDAI